MKFLFFAISFGAYILLNKLIGDNSKYKNIVLKSPTLNMKEIFINCLIKEPFEQYKKQGKVNSINNHCCRKNINPDKLAYVDLSPMLPKKIIKRDNKVVEEDFER